METPTFSSVLVVVLALTIVVESAAIKRFHPVNLSEREIYEQIERLVHQNGGRHPARQPQPRAGAPKPQHVTNWPNKPLEIGDLGGVAVNSLNNPVIFHRGNNRFVSGIFDGNNVFVNRDKPPIEVDTILCLNQSDGSVYHSMGRNRFYMPHGLHIDRDENIWVTDVALHQVMKFPRGSSDPSLVLGEKFVPGEGKYHFCKPTGVAVASNGDFFVSDGYCNSRVIKYNAAGSWLTEWGHSYGKDEFNIAHSISLIEEMDLVCVSDRENERIMCYSAGLSDNEKAGKFILRVSTNQRGKMFSITNAGNGFVYGVVYGNKGQGITVDLEIGEITDTWAPVSGNQTFAFPHAIDIAPDGGNLYVIDVNPPKVYKFNLQ